MGPDGKVFVFARGQVSIGGFLAEEAASVQKNIPSAGKISERLSIEKNPPSIFYHERDSEC